MAYFPMSDFFGFLSITPFKTIKLQKLGVFWKIQEICNKMGTRICKIVEEMSEIIELKVGNPENLFSRNWAILSHPWNRIFFEDDIFQLFLQIWLKSTKMKFRPCFALERVQKLMENT